VVDDLRADELIRRVNTGENVLQTIAGAVLTRTRKSHDAGGRKTDPFSNPSFHLKLALKRSARPDVNLDPSSEMVSRTAADQDPVYTDFHDRVAREGVDPFGSRS
jgi:hypothetical protein